MTAGPNWYDVLDVDPSASSDEIRDAWRAAIADLTPADRRFRLYNEAAEVLLDPARRAEYDATLAAEQPEPEPEPTPEPKSEPAPEPIPAPEPEPLSDEPADLPREPRSLPGVPTWALAALGVLAALAVGVAAYLFTTPSPDAVDEATASARAAAERAIVPVLSYDYRDLEASSEAAHAVMTSSYREDEYDPFFTGVVEPNAEDTKTIVEAEFVASSVVRGGEDRVELLLFVNRPTTNAETKQPVVYKDQVRVIMAREGDQWLVDCLITTPEGKCGE